MKKLLLFINFLFILLFFSVAQNPAFTYQAVVRNVDGKLVNSATIGARISVMHNAPNGTMVYSETHMATTSAQGLATFRVGGGTVVSGSLQNIDWGDGSYFLKSEIDINGGTNYTLTSSQQILGVPLAHYAQTAGNLPQFDYHALPDTPIVVSHFINDAGYLTHYDETQELSFSNDTLFLTGGSYVVLPIPNPNTDSLTNIIDSLSDVLYSMHRAPKVQTLSFVAIDSNNAEGAGEVVFEGLNGSVTARGFCWNTSGRPTFADNVISQGSGAGVFTAQMHDLTKVNTYYVRAFAINSTDTVFGAEVAFNTISLSDYDSLLGSNRAPMVITMNFAADDTATVTGDGEVIFEGLKGSVSSRGFCYNTTGMPTLSDSVKSSSSGLGTYTLQIEGLTAATKYYVRAFAINATDTAYGNEITVTTLYLPVVMTDTAYAAGYTSAKFFGTVADDGGDAITSRGFVYNTNGNPTLADTIVGAGSGMGTFFATTDKLDTATTYYVRAFAINALDTVYGEEKSFATFSLPDFRIDSVNAGDYFAAVHVTIVDAASDTVLERGLCYSVDNATPTRNDNTLICGKGSANFTDTLKKLSSRTTYYVTAYFMTPNGIYYSAPATFTTVTVEGDPCPGLETITDYNNNSYKTIWIHNQCWMRENLRATNFADGTEIVQRSCGDEYSCSEYGYHIPGETFGGWNTKYGLLYDYHTAIKEDCTCDDPSSRQGVCPDGWVIPTLEEWQSISDYVRVHPDLFIDRCLGVSEGWRDHEAYCEDNYWHIECADNDFMSWAYYWTFDKFEPFSAYDVEISLDEEEYNWYESFWDQGNYMGVRCIRDVKPRVITTSMNKTANGIEVYGEIISENDTPVTSYGFCYGVTSKPTVENNSVVEVGTSMVSSFNTTISGFEPNVIYHVRAYATNSYGTEYGKSFAFSIVGTDSKSCPGTDSILVDIDGNRYATIMMDGQCWMRSNMRVTQTNDETLMDLSDPWEDYYDDADMPYYAYPNNDESMVELYGNLYNHMAASSICPIGWHLPITEEWEALNDYVVNQGMACDGVYTSKALASNSGWTFASNDEYCSVCNNFADNNATGFNLMPAGYMEGEANEFMVASFLWLSEAKWENSSLSVWMDAWSGKPRIEAANDVRYQSVRCVKTYMPILGKTIAESAGMTDATLTSNVLYEEMGTIIEAGFCYNTTGMPTLGDNVFTVGFDEKYITGTVTSLSTDVQIYYVRSYAITSTDTIYGLESKFIKPVIDDKSCIGATTVTDWDGNVYGTVQIGTQCWMRDNLKSTHYAGGDSITMSFKSSESIPYYYYPNEQQGNFLYGWVYNWSAVMNGSDGTDDEQVQGICPTGWHIPTSSEWNTLINNVKADSDNWCGGDSTKISAALSVDYGWDSYSGNCVIGNSNVIHNQTGFSAFPPESNSDVYYWTSSSSSMYSNHAYIYWVRIWGQVSHGESYIVNKYAVRCIKNY